MWSKKEAKVKLSEIYTSIQGEGPRTGQPTTFVRFGGCNLRCPGWGVGKLPDGSEVRGCDTVFAVYPQWRHTWENVSVDEVVSRIPSHPTNICVTGGEPLIQKGIGDLISDLYRRGYTIDVFTNGTQYLADHPILSHHNMIDAGITIVMDYKLPGSGEFGSFKYENLDQLHDHDVLKFVVQDRTDFDTAKAFIREHYKVSKHGFQLYFTPVWGQLPAHTLAHWVASEAPGSKMALQTHKYIFGDVRGT